MRKSPEHCKRQTSPSAGPRAHFARAVQRLTLLVSGSALASGCAAAEGQSTTAPKARTPAAVASATGASSTKARTGTPAAAGQPRDPTYAQKQALVGDMGRRLVELQREIDQLSAQVDRSRAAARADAKAKLAIVRQQWTRAKEQLDQAAKATDTTWETVKRGVRKSYAEVQDSFEETRQWLSDKIEPASKPPAARPRSSGRNAKSKE